MRSALVVTAFLVLAALPWSAGAAASEGRYIVGYRPGGEAQAKLAVELAGGTVVRDSADLDFYVVRTADAGRFERLAPLQPSLRYVERDDPTRLAGAQWNGVQWDAATWDGAQWNGAQWNGAQWNGAQWNTVTWRGAQWNGAQWNGAQWNLAEWAQFGPRLADPGLVWQWGLWKTDTPTAWLAEKGQQRASLCVLDSGVAWDHPDLKANVRAPGYNAIDPSRTAYDDAGHGTHVAGIAAARIGDGYGVAGVGNVSILPVKVLAADGAGRESDLAIGIAWCASHGAKVAVMALSATEPGPTMDAALQYAVDRDVLLLASAGNAGPCSDCVSYPASDPRVVGVSALTMQDTLADFSSKGPQVDLAAPGERILSAFPGNSFVYGSGTSQAVAFAAGAAALVRDADAGLTAAQARDALLRSADDLGAAGRDDSFGEGRLDVDEAVAMAKA